MAFYEVDYGQNGGSETEVEYVDMGTNSSQATLTHTFNFAPDYFLLSGLGGYTSFGLYKKDKTTIARGGSSDAWESTKFSLSADGKTITYKCDHNAAFHDRLMGIKGIEIS